MAKIYTKPFTQTLKTVTLITPDTAKNLIYTVPAEGAEVHRCGVYNSTGTNVGVKIYAKNQLDYITIFSTTTNNGSLYRFLVPSSSESPFYLGSGTEIYVESAMSGIQFELTVYEF